MTRHIPMPWTISLSCLVLQLEAEHLNVYIGRVFSKADRSTLQIDKLGSRCRFWEIVFFFTDKA